MIDWSTLTEDEAIRYLYAAHERLIALGWQSAKYCPKDGTPFTVIELGSTGKFRCTYNDEDPMGGFFMIEDGRDVYPTTTGVALFRKIMGE